MLPFGRVSSWQIYREQIHAPFKSMESYLANPARVGRNELRGTGVLQSEAVFIYNTHPGMTERVVIPEGGKAAPAAVCVKIQDIGKCRVGFGEKENDVAKESKNIITFASTQGSLVMKEGLCIPGTHPELPPIGKAMCGR